MNEAVSVTEHAGAAAPLSAKDYKSDYKPIWCPGCGDYSVLGSITKAFALVQVRPENIAVVSGIGCSSRIPAYTACYGFHGVHGRSLAAATGLKVARPDLTVLVAGGDGDGYSIGGNHFLHACRRNVDLTYIVMDNQIYGLTKGQLSPTSPRGLHTVTSEFGSLENPINPLLLLLAYGAGFVAQGTPVDMPGLAQIIEAAIRFPGFSFVNVQSPCVTYGHEEQQAKAQKGKLKTLASLGHDPSDRLAAMALAQSYGTELHTGIFYQDPNPPPTYTSLVADRQQALADGLPRERVLELFAKR